MASEAAQPPAKRIKVPSFTESFWSADYAAGLGVLFTKLQQGVSENQQVLTIATLRAEAEEQYSERLGDIAPTVDRIHGGFGRDDGASVRKAYEGVRSEMIEATKNHQKIATSIRELVVNPFGRWCDAHAQRVQNSQDELTAKIKAHDRQSEAVKKLRAAYFNKCRLVEDQEEENKFAFQDPQDTKGKEKEASSPKPISSNPPTIVVQPEEDVLPIEIGDQTYPPDALKKLLTDMLSRIPLGETKVPIIGTYQNTSSGADITQYVMQYMNATKNMEYAENIGQDLVDRGFLRLIGNVGSTFANSSKMKYQWRPRAFQITGIPEKKAALGRASTIGSVAESLPDSPVVSNVTATIAAWNPLNNPYPNETLPERLRREAKQSDDNYKAGIRKLDLLRCNLEESIMDHLKFLERCETDRLKAIRSVILDFSGAISNSIPSFQSQVDHMMLYQETINPLSDLRYLLENYKTGPFLPKVVSYENYYGSVDDQVFGVDLEARARADKKRVPLIITSILTFLDKHYPDLDGDPARRSIWTIDVPLAATHHLRNEINISSQIKPDLFERYEIPIVASLLKLYLLELPDSLVSSTVYDIIKTVYEQTQDAPSAAHSDPASSDSATQIDNSPRIKVLQSTLSQLKLNNIATLDAITTHFTRLIDLTSADDEYVSYLASILAPCILRPRLVNTLTMGDRHPYRLVRDLFEHKDAIFGELKRQASSSGHHGASSAAAAAAAASGATSNGLGVVGGGNRSRAISTTDESSRRAAMEARAKAINDTHARSKSPAPGPRHRRDRSTDGSVSGAGRFPIAVVSSPRPDRNSTPSTNKRSSLEVPGSLSNSPIANRGSVETTTTHASPSQSNSMSSFTRDSMTSEPTTVSMPNTSTPATATNGESNKRDSSTVSPSSPMYYGAIPDGAMAGAFGSNTHSSSSIYGSTPDSTSHSTPADTTVDNKTSSSSLRRTALTGSGKTKTPSGRYGSLKGRSNLSLGGETIIPAVPARDDDDRMPSVQLEDRAMDDDFS